jgi:hypothetical protein
MNNEQLASRAKIIMVIDVLNIFVFAGVLIFFITNLADNPKPIVFVLMVLITIMHFVIRKWNTAEMKKIVEELKIK